MISRPKADWDGVVHISDRAHISGNKELGKWLQSQRETHKNGDMRSDRHALLDLLGSWFFADSCELQRLVDFGKFKNRIRQLQAFVVDGKISLTKKHEGSLYQFIMKQRKQRRDGELPREREELLNQLGMW